VCRHLKRRCDLGGDWLSLLASASASDATKDQPALSIKEVEVYRGGALQETIPPGGTSVQVYPPGAPDLEFHIIMTLSGGDGPSNARDDEAAIESNTATETMTLYQFDHETLGGTIVNRVGNFPGDPARVSIPTSTLTIGDNSVIVSGLFSVTTAAAIEPPSGSTATGLFQIDANSIRIRNLDSGVYVEAPDLFNFTLRAQRL